ncbi:MAG: prolyl oligopeptidase family serine peptidase [Lentisphaeria bacterium]|nr:prolyl oligopeptidase family serine peptidase [Lentisphaeria bacterium]
MERIKTIEYRCSWDNSMQKAKCFIAPGTEPRPLLVALHTWSFTYEQDCSAYAAYCLKNNWNFIFPDFRGPNWTPEACGSDAVVEDIADAVAYMKQAALVDNDRVYLLGGSGGGHASLLLAARRPELWTAVSAWCAISDVALWHDQCAAAGRGYAEHIEKACGGNPAEDEKARAEAQRRSPVTHLGNASRCLLDISTGIHDGHTGSVPVNQTLNAFNILAKPEDKISAEDIAFITENQQFPAHYPAPVQDPSFGKNTVLFRRQSNLTRVTIFEGGHDCLPVPGLDWLSRQNRRQAPDWSEGKASASEAFELGK